MFLKFWRFQPQSVLKLFLLSDISKQWITCPEQQKGAKKYLFAIFLSSDMRKTLKLSIQCPRTSRVVHSSSTR